MAHAGPMLIVFTGPPCSGKSTLAAELARRHGWEHLSMDATRQRILPGTHTEADRHAAYRAMHFAAELLARAGRSVILDAPYRQLGDRDDLARAVAAGGARLKWIECHVAPETASARQRIRGYDAERADLNEPEVAERAHQHPYTGQGLLLETGEFSPEDCLRQVEDYLR
ncbi:MAG: ATP-binding protein [Bryobacteraceae bacterium]